MQFHSTYVPRRALAYSWDKLSTKTWPTVRYVLQYVSDGSPNVSGRTPTYLTEDFITQMRSNFLALMSFIVFLHEHCIVCGHWTVWSSVYILLILHFTAVSLGMWARTWTVGCHGFSCSPRMYCSLSQVHWLAGVPADNIIGMAHWRWLDKQWFPRDSVPFLTHPLPINPGLGVVPKYNGYIQGDHL